MINLSSNSWLKTGSRLATRDDDGCERNTDAGMPRGPRGHLEAINVIATVLPNVLLLFQSFFAGHWTFYFPQKPILATFWIRGIKFKKCVFSFQVRFWLLRLLELDWTDWTFICAICVIYTWVIYGYCTILICRNLKFGILSKILKTREVERGILYQSDCEIGRNWHNNREIMILHWTMKRK